MEEGGGGGFAGDLRGNGGRRSVVTIRVSRRNYRKLTAYKMPMGGGGGAVKKRHYAPVPLSSLVHFEKVLRFSAESRSKPNQIPMVTIRSEINKTLN